MKDVSKDLQSINYIDHIIPHSVIVVIFLDIFYSIVASILVKMIVKQYGDPRKVLHREKTRKYFKVRHTHQLGLNDLISRS